MLKIVIIDDDQDQAETLRLLFDLHLKEKEIQIYDSLGIFFESIDLLSSEENEQIIILDIELKHINSLDHIEKIQRFHPNAKILIYSGFISEHYLLSALKKGVCGYVLKGGDPQIIIEAVDTILRGDAYLDPKISAHVINIFQKKDIQALTKGKIFNLDIYLTLREQQVATGLMDGLSYQEIADANNLSINTIRHHVQSLYRKLKVNSKIELVKKLRNNN
jgi:DNA-binding NarL/FixJ family response regulator